VTPLPKRQAIAILHGEHGLPVHRACEAVWLSRAAYYRPPIEGAQLERDQPVIDALQTKVSTNTRWGFWKCFDSLRLEGYGWNHKRVHRVYCAPRLNIPRRTRRRVPRRLRQPLVAADALTMTWALDFMVDTLYDGRRFRTLNVIDESNREGLAIQIGTTLPNLRVIAVLEELIALHGTPQHLRVDNGPSSPRSRSPHGVKPTAFTCATYSPASHRRTPSSSGSTAPTERTFSPRPCSLHSPKCAS